MQSVAIGNSKRCVCVNKDLIKSIFRMVEHVLNLVICHSSVMIKERKEIYDVEN